jgi:hypothetical protein
MHQSGRNGPSAIGLFADAHDNTAIRQLFYKNALD